MEHLDDDELLGRTPSCPAAFAVFYRRHERSADLAAETFAAALIGAARHRGGREPAVAWLFGIARNKLLHARRRGAVEDRARRRLGVEPLILDDETLARVDRLPAGEWGTALLAELPAEQARAIRARVIEERSYEQIATAMRRSQRCR